MTRKTVERVLETAAERGRVSALTAPQRTIDRMVGFGYLKPDDELAGIYRLTTLGLCQAGRCPF